MPELPDIEAYLHALRRVAEGRVLERVRVSSFSLLKTFDPPLEAVAGQVVRGFRRIGKRIVWEFDDELFLVLHLMIAGRLRQHEKGKPIPRKVGAAAFDLPDTTIILTEAGTKNRAGLWVVRGEAALAEHDRGGVEPLEASASEFRAAITAQNRTLKRVLTDQHILSGIGNAFSDEILLVAGLSPVKTTAKLTDEEHGRLYEATQRVLTEWKQRLIAEAGDAFPDKVTAFRPEFGAHGRYEQPCPRCGHAIQRIRYADNETNYCASCQTGGKVLADRSLSRLLKDDWPRSIEELEG